MLDSYSDHKKFDFLTKFNTLKDYLDARDEQTLIDDNQSVSNNKSPHVESSYSTKSLTN